MEIKRLEQAENRYRADRDDLLRTVMGIDSNLIGFESADEVLGVEKVRQNSRVLHPTEQQNKKRRRPDEGEGVTTLLPTKNHKESAAFGGLCPDSSSSPC